jgi:hypothetical protein
LNKYARTAISSLGEASLISAIDLVLAVVALALFRTGVLEAFGLILLLESSALMLMGGAVSFAGQEGFQRLASLLTRVELKPGARDGEKNEMKAALYALTGVILFVESSVLASLTL